MILGNERKLLSYLKGKESPHYENDATLSEKINCSVPSLKSYRKKLKQLGMLNFKAVYVDRVKQVAYELIDEVK